MDELANKSLVQVIGGDKFRTTPISSTITQVKQLPQSAIIYKCAASSYWQFRVFLEGAQRRLLKSPPNEMPATFIDKIVDFSGKTAGCCDPKMAECVFKKLLGER